MFMSHNSLLICILTLVIECTVTSVDNQLHHGTNHQLDTETQYWPPKRAKRSKSSPFNVPNQSISNKSESVEYLYAVPSNTSTNFTGRILPKIPVVDLDLENLGGSKQDQTISGSPGKCGKAALNPPVEGTTDGWFPWHVSILCGNEWCSGTIVSEVRVLTSVDCIFSIKRSRLKCTKAIVVAGTNEIRTDPVKPRSQIRDSYGAMLSINEGGEDKAIGFALINVQIPFVFNSFVQPLCINRSMETPYKQCWRQGGDRESSNKLTTHYQVTFANQCFGTGDGKTDKELCFWGTFRLLKYNPPPCVGDQGGAVACLVQDIWFLVGIAKNVEDMCLYHFFRYAGFVNVARFHQEIYNLDNMLSSYISSG